MSARRPGAPAPLAAHLAAGLADLQQGVALATLADDPRFPWRRSSKSAVANLAAELRALKAASAQDETAQDETAQDRTAQDQTAQDQTAPDESRPEARPPAPEATREIMASFAKTVAEAALEDVSRALDGVAAYRKAAPLRRPADPPAIWREGAARLLDFGGVASRDDATPLLALPSLVNSPAILDLTRARSFLRGLAARGVRPFLLDWGPPGAIERRFDVGDYARERAVPALEAAAAAAGRPVALLGHCMGGAIAAATATLAPHKVSHLALLATPWDFEPLGSRYAGAAREVVATLIDACDGAFGGVPPDILNTLFFLRDPLQAMRKFPRAATLDRRGPAERLFVAVEDWLNDGRLLAGPAARTLFLDWGIDNALARQAWRVALDRPQTLENGADQGGAAAADPGEDPAEEPRLRTRAVTLSGLDAPIMIAASRTDTLTPFASARGAFAEAHGARLIRPTGGHIGMLVGRSAEAELWDPLAAWLRTR